MSAKLGTLSASSAMRMLGALKRGGSLNSVRDRLASFEERQRLVQKGKYDRFETLYTN